MSVTTMVLNNSYFNIKKHVSEIFGNGEVAIHLINVNSLLPVYQTNIWAQNF